MHVDRLPSGSWRVRVSANGRRASATRRTRREAEIAGGQLLAELGAVPTSNTTVRELLDIHLAAHGYAPTTRDRLEWGSRALPDGFLRRPVWEVTPVMIDQAYAAMLAGGATVHTVRAAHTVLSSALTRAVRWGWLLRNPARDAAAPAEPRREVSPPADGDVLRALQAAGPDLVAFLTMAATTGARRGELCGLQWGDVDVDGDAGGAVVIRRGVTYTPGSGLIVNEGKTGRRGHRVIALDTGTANVMRAHRARREAELDALGLPWRPDRFVFSSDTGERPWRPDYATWRWRRLRAEVDLGGVRLHDLRHYMATSALTDGVPASVVAGRLGHTTSATTTRVYAHFVPAADVDAAERIAARLNGGR